MTRPAFFWLLLISVQPALARCGDLPLHADDRQVIRTIVRHEKLDAPPEVNPRGWPQIKGQDIVRFRSADNPRHALTVAHDDQGRVTQLVGNGPLLCNDAFGWVAQLPELRIIRIDHNIPRPGSDVSHEQYDGSGIAALKDSRLEEIRIGHAFDDDGMRALAGITK